jgi:hypothetical protein
MIISSACGSAIPIPLSPEKAPPAHHPRHNIPAQHHAGQPGARRLSSEFIAKRGMMQLRLHKSP